MEQVIEDRLGAPCGLRSPATARVRSCSILRTASITGSAAACHEVGFNGTVQNGGFLAKNLIFWAAGQFPGSWRSTRDGS